jgi:hypothetical protein
MSCAECKNLFDIEDLSSPYVIRTCPKCKRKINLREPGEKGHGIRVGKGDQFIFPNGWLQLSANPLKGRGTLTKGSIRNSQQVKRPKSLIVFLFIIFSRAYCEAKGEALRYSMHGNENFRNCILKH